MAEKRVVTEGIAHIKAHFNNTLITITDRQGNKLASSSPPQCGYKGSKKSTPFAAGKAAEDAATKAMDMYNLKAVDVKISGAGLGREAAIKALQAAGLKVLSMEDRTGIPHNGCRDQKKRRI